MKFKLSKEKFQDAMSKIDRVLKAKSPIPILSGVLVQALSDYIVFTASDGTESVIHRIPVEDEVVVIEAEGSSVFSKDCLDVVKKLKDIITFETEGLFVKVSQKKTNLEFGTLDAAEFPQISASQDSKPIVFSGKEFGDIVAQTAFAASPSETRPILQGVNMAFSKEGNIYSCTDSHRLAQIKTGAYQCDEDMSITVPAKTLENVLKCFDLSSEVIVLPSDVNIALLNGNTMFLSRLIEGNYPDVQRLIPNEFVSNLVVNKKEFQEALEILSLMAKNNVVKMKLDGLFAEISAAEETAKGSRQIAFESYDGDENFSIGFSAKFVLDALRSMESDRINIGFNGAMKPFVMKPIKEEDNTIQLVLPVRLTA